MEKVKKGEQDENNNISRGSNHARGLKENERSV
jgi:hypothetical protein